MQFLITAYDGKDEGALQRRFAVREQHLKLIEAMANEKKLLCAGAILDDSGKMIGSVLMADFPSKVDLDEWLEIEPYVTGKVWETIEIKPFKVPQFFLDLNK